MGIKGKFIAKILSGLPRKSVAVYQFCQNYVDEYNGENNDNIEINGELRLMKTYLSDSKVVFDVGTNVGNWARLALEINPSIHLHCFEPSAFTYQKLLENHFPQNVVCNHFGLSSKNQQAHLLIFDEGSGMNSLYKREGLEKSHGIAPQVKSEIIHLKTLDDYVSSMGIDQIDFLKTDIEGHELECFRGARKLLSQNKIKLIQFEYGGCNIDARVFLKDIFYFFRDFQDFSAYFAAC